MPTPRLSGAITRNRLLRQAFYATAATTTTYLVYRSYKNSTASRIGGGGSKSSSFHASSTPPKFPQLPTRAEQLARLRAASSSSQKDGAAAAPYDLLIIGGGATGAGVALDAATRGLKVALIERDDFSCGTSSKSTKLVHGGVRYLEKAFKELDYNQYLLVKEALKERAVFLNTAPHLSMALPIMLPIYTWWKLPYFWVGTKMYDWLAGAENLEGSYFLTKGKACEQFPMLKEEGLVGALVYYDGSHNDSRMNVAIATTAALHGATVINHVEVNQLIKDPVTGQITGVRVRDLLPPPTTTTKKGKGGKKTQQEEEAVEFSVPAKGVVNATGPFTDSIRILDDPSVPPIVAPSSGVHIVLPGYYSPQRMGLIDPSTSDGRVIFFLPWQGNTIAGTTDAPTEITPHPLPLEEEINWILSEVRRYLAPDINVRRGDVLAAWSGIRPLVKDPNAKNTESLVRSHLINTSPSGLLTIAGGKWTTYRQMAEETVDHAIQYFNLRPTTTTSGSASFPPCQTEHTKLIGAHGYSTTLFINLIQHYGLETPVAQHLAHAYGDRAWTVAHLASPTHHTRFPARGLRLSPLYPFIDGEVVYAVRNEYAQTAVDVLARRTRLAFLNAQAALEALPMVIDIMSLELAWGEDRRAREWDEGVRFLESMGLPRMMVGVTRAQVEGGIVGRWAEEEEGRRYSRPIGL
ncbi:glycerol-3-phosphate dehydrogenase [Peziza echinospora]|nr:glycerol-3-phosphate dehydrogenase [Peziza echinospora]